MGSDLMAAEALQEAETEVGGVAKVDRDLGRSTDTVLGVGLTA